MKRVILTLCGAALLCSLTAAVIQTDSSIRIAEGNIEGRMTNIPWAGQWWAQDGNKMVFGWNGSDEQNMEWNEEEEKYERVAISDYNDAAPLAKYSEAVKRQTGTDPEADLNEVNNEDEGHNVNPKEREDFEARGIGFGWWGHCNGWAAASVMEKEPKHPITVEGIRFDVADLKALLSESFYGNDSDFTGSRYYDPRGKTALRDRADSLLTVLNDDEATPDKELYKTWYEDMYNEWYRTDDYEFTNASYTADTFKGVLEWYIGYYKEKYVDAKADVIPHVFDAILVTLLVNQGRGAVMDMDAGPEVWNFPFHACEIERTFKEDIDGGKRFSVETKLYYQSDGVDYSILGVREHVNTYTYEIDTDAEGKAVDSRWIGDSVEDHPDFIWLPTYNPTGPDSDENSKLEWGVLREWLTSDHASDDARVLTFKVNGTKSNDQRVGRVARTISNPLDASGELSFAVDLLDGHDVDKVSYFRQNISHLTGQSWKSVAGDMVHLGDGSGDDFAFSHTPTSSGRKMFVALAYAGDKLVSSDELTVMYTPGATTPPTPTGDDSFEENDSRRDAALISAGTHSGLECNDDDFYKVEVPANGSLNVRIDFEHRTGDLDMRLFRPDDSALGTSESTDNVESIRKEHLEAGTYVIQVYGYSNAKAPYSLTVAVEAGTSTPPVSNDDSFEENDTQSAASEVGVGSYGDLLCEDADWYKLELSANQTVKIRIEFSHNAGDIDLYLVDANGDELDKSWSASDNEELSHTASAAGPVWFKVVGYQGAEAPYALTVE